MTQEWVEVGGKCEQKVSSVRPEADQRRRWQKKVGLIEKETQKSESSGGFTVQALAGGDKPRPYPRSSS